MEHILSRFIVLECVRFSQNSDGGSICFTKYRVTCFFSWWTEMEPLGSEHLLFRFLDTLLPLVFYISFPAGSICISFSWLSSLLVEKNTFFSGCHCGCRRAQWRSIPRLRYLLRQLANSGAAARKNTRLELGRSLHRGEKKKGVIFGSRALAIGAHNREGVIKVFIFGWLLSSLFSRLVFSPPRLEGTES